MLAHIKADLNSRIMGCRGSNVEVESSQALDVYAAELKEESQQSRILSNATSNVEPMKISHIQVDKRRSQNLQRLQEIHPRTMDRMLRGKGIRKWIARKRPKLLPRHASARLAWALERKDWTVEQWKKYINVFVTTIVGKGR